MSEIGNEPVGYIEHRMGDTGQPRPQFDTRLRQLETPDQRDSLFSWHRFMATSQHLQTQDRIADRTGYPDPVPGARAAAADLGAGGNLADRGQRQHRGSVGRNRVAAEKIDFVAPLILAEPRSKSL